MCAISKYVSANNFFREFNADKKRHKTTMALKPDGSTKKQSAFCDIPAVFISTRGLYSEADKALVDSIWQKFGLNDRDHVRIFVVPIGSRIQTGSFIHRPTENAATRRLSLQIMRKNNRLQEIEREKTIEKNEKIYETEDDKRTFDTNEQTRRELIREQNFIRRNIERSTRSLNAERRRLANGPRFGFIVVQSGGE